MSLLIVYEFCVLLDMCCFLCFMLLIGENFSLNMLEMIQSIDYYLFDYGLMISNLVVP
ncbi:hypothetical protein HanPI659440_Chr05g0194711 [Helianthus annuus]|nr:hypothetical protein HanPI659440_Chr05g0194711 [Helianthus annuus]